MDSKSIKFSNQKIPSSSRSHTIKKINKKPSASHLKKINQMVRILPFNKYRFTRLRKDLRLLKTLCLNLTYQSHSSYIIIKTYVDSTSPRGILLVLETNN